MRTKLVVEGKVFIGKHKDGDFDWMVRQPSYDDAVFLITENFLDSMRDDAGAGGGTATLRLYCPQRIAEGERPRAVGVPTGWSIVAGGFGEMDSFVKTAIDLSIDRIAYVLDQHRSIRRLIYSSDADNPRMIGVKIFEDTLKEEVREYISTKILNMATHVPSCTVKQIERAELRMLRICLQTTLLMQRKKKKNKPVKHAVAGKEAMFQSTLITQSHRPFGGGV